MRAEPPDFQYATTAGLAGQTTSYQAGVDQSQILAIADIDAANSISSEWNFRPVPDFADVVHPADMGLKPVRKLSKVLDELRASVVPRYLSIGGAVVVAFGLGWACASMFGPNPGMGLISLDRKTDVSLGRPDAERQAVRRNHRITNAAAAPNPTSVEPNKARFSVSVTSARLRSIAAQSIQERTSAPGASFAPSDSDLPIGLSPVPDTKPTTIPGWTVRDVYGEKAIIAGPEQVWTVRTGDTVPGLGRIDSIVRWGDRWIVATTAGLVSTE